MKKALLSLATVLCALSANAQGLSSVGANIVIMPSVKWDKQAYEAKTYVVNSGISFGTWTSEKNEDGTYVNPNYNVIAGAPSEDSWGLQWYEPGYDFEDEIFEDEDVQWETHTAPFAKADSYNGLPSYQWTTGDCADIYVVRTFTTTSLLPNDVWLACSHDDAPCEYYLNGKLIWSETDGWNENEIYKLTEEQKALIKKDGSENVLAFHVHQNWGGAYADAGLYTSVVGGLDMGYVTPWTGRTLFNSWGGYVHGSYASAFRNAGALNEWEALYEAGADDVYTIKGIPATFDPWESQIHFKTPIDIVEGHEYTFKCTLETNDEFSATIKLCGNDDDETELSMDEDVFFDSAEPYDYSTPFTGAIDNLKIVFNFAWGPDAGADVSISKMSVYDETDGKELWVGTSFFNYMYFLKDGKQIKTPKVTGRVESKSWTMADYDDSAWDETPMPIGNYGYGGMNLGSIWPGNMFDPEFTGDGDGGENTGYWIRRTWNIDKINPKLSYALNVCHDDDYETYVNGHLLQTNTGWTNGKNPVQVHIPASYLNEGVNVIATEIHQNWGGRFYDCGINVEEVDYDAEVEAFKAAIAAAEAWEGDLTEAMRANYATVIADAKEFLATEIDAAELKDYREKVLVVETEKIQGYSSAVVAGRQMMKICANQNGYKGEMKTVMPTAEEFEAMETANAVNDLVSKLKMARKRAASERRPNTFKGAVAAAGDYYIYNVGEELFLGGGETWGTHMALEYASNAMRLIPAETEEGPVENGFVIETFRPNGDLGVGDFLGYNGYVDVGAKDIWVFVPVEGKSNVYNIRRNVENGENGENGVYIGYRGARDAEGEYDNQNGYSWCTVDTDMRSPELASNQWMLITKEELDAQVEKATATSPVDMTHLISNPGFDQRLTLANWENYNVFGRNGNYPDFVNEAYNDDCSLSQEVEDDAIIEGWWTIECNGYYRDGEREDHAAKLEAGEDPEQCAILYAGDEEMPLCRIDQPKVVIPYTVSRTYVYNGVRCPDYPTDAAEFFEHGAYKNVLAFEVEDAGSVFFGIETVGEAPGRWTVVDNFRLKYWGTEEPQAITEVNASVKAPKGIYNLNGQKLEKAVKGVNIINGKKVVVK